MATAPIYVATPKIGIGLISAANTNRDGTGTIVDVFTAGTSGSRIERVVVTGIGTTTAGMVRLYLYDGTNNRLWKEIVVSAITVGASTAAFTATLSSLGLVLPTGWKLRASTHNAESFNVSAEGGDF